MDNNYLNWSLHSLLLEISKRRLTHGVSEQSFPDPGDRKRRLVEMLEGDDRLFNRHPEILKYGYQVEGYEYAER
jgi:hypothetical protein